MRLNKFSATIDTTGDDGKATGSGSVAINVTGFIESVRFDYHASAPAATDVVLSDSNHGTIFTESNNASDVTRYPRRDGEKYLVDGTVTVAVSQCNALTGAVTVTVSVTAESLMAVSGVGLSDYQNVVVVDPNGNGDYTTQAAALAAITDDDASHVYNVFLFGEVIAWATWAGRPFIKVHGQSSKIYKAILTQSGTSAPTVTVLENSIGSIVWTRTAVGNYTATLTGAFPSDKTLVLVGAMGGTTTGMINIIKANRFSDNLVKLYTAVGYDNILPQDFALSDGLLSGTPIVIEVYP